MIKHAHILILSVFISMSALAGGQYYEFEGLITKVQDYTSNSVVEQHYQTHSARYIIYINDELDAYFLSSGRKIKKKDYYSNENLFTNYDYADYVCGNALELGYGDKHYFIAESKKTYSSSRAVVHAGARLDIQAPYLVNEWFLGMPTTAKDYYWPDSSSASWALADLTLVDIHSENPCN